MGGSKLRLTRFMAAEITSDRMPIRNRKTSLGIQFSSKTMQQAFSICPALRKNDTRKIPENGLHVKYSIY